jgi:hypothetical protein
LPRRLARVTVWPFWAGSREPGAGTSTQTAYRTSQGRLVRKIDLPCRPRQRRYSQLLLPKLSAASYGPSPRGAKRPDDDEGDRTLVEKCRPERGDQRRIVGTQA